MHGPIPMKVESCRAEMLRACISPAQILRQGSFQATLVGLRTFGRRTHEDEWDEVRWLNISVGEEEKKGNSGEFLSFGFSRKTALSEALGEIWHRVCVYLK